MPSIRRAAAARRRWMLSAGLAVAASASLAAAGATAADAATSAKVVKPGQVATLTSNFLGGTDVCVINDHSTSTLVRVRPDVNLDNLYDDIHVDPHRTECIRRWWFGSTLRATNLGAQNVEVLSR